MTSPQNSRLITFDKPDFRLAMSSVFNPVTNSPKNGQAEASSSMNTGSEAHESQAISAQTSSPSATTAYAAQDV